MVKLHLIDPDSNLKEVHYVQHAPRVGDEIRLRDDRFYKVKRIVWCFDEHTDDRDRANVELQPA